MSIRNRLMHPLGMSSSRPEQLTLAVVIGFFGSIGFSIPVPLLPELATELDMTDLGTGLLQAAVAIPGIFLSVFAAYGADRFGRTRMIVLGLTGIAVFGAAGFWAATSTELTLTRFLQGVAIAACQGLGVVLIADLCVGVERARLIGVYAAGIIVGQGVGPVLAGVLAERFTVFTPFLIYLAALPIALWATRIPEKAGGASRSPFRHIGSAIADVRRRGRLGDFVAVLAQTLVVFVCVQGAVFIGVPLYLATEFGADSASLGAMIGVMYFVMLATSTRAARLAQKRGVGIAIAVGTLVMALGYTLAAAVGTYGAILVSLGIVGAGLGLVMPTSQLIAVSLGGTSYRPFTQLSWETSCRVAQVAGPVAGAWIGYQLGFQFLFGLAALALVVSVATGWIRSKNRGKSGPLE